MQDLADALGDSIHILLVEDDDDHAQIVRRAVRNCSLNFKIFHVEDGMQALAYLKRQGAYQDRETPQIILLDLKLPKLGGHELLEKIKLDSSIQDIPVIVLTTSDAEMDMRRAYAHNANSYLVKPLDGLTFRKMIEETANYWSRWNRCPPPPSSPNLVAASGRC